MGGRRKEGTSGPHSGDGKRQRKKKTIRSTHICHAWFVLQIFHLGKKKRGGMCEYASKHSFLTATFSKAASGGTKEASVCSLAAEQQEKGEKAPLALDERRAP